jgi:pSer/pThr/pTyr-binding forkhead associated (FHA) protein
MCGTTLGAAAAQPGLAAGTQVPAGTPADVASGLGAKPASAAPDARYANGATEIAAAKPALQGAPMHAVGGQRSPNVGDPTPTESDPAVARATMHSSQPSVPAPTRPPPSPAQELAGISMPNLPAPRNPSVAPAPGGSVVQCWRCGAQANQAAAFCQSCGAQLRDAERAGNVHALPAPQARLIVIAQDGTAGQEYPIPNGQIDVGREAGDVRIATDGYACPRHARIAWKNGTFWVTDLGSVNGVFVRLTGAERLQHGDTILLGMGVVRFEIVTSHEMSLAPAIERGTRLFGSPATPRYARLVERTVEGIARNVMYLSKNVVTIGRETGDIVFTDDPFMSRQHACLERQSDGTFLLKDLGSSNGTFMAIRGERVLPDGSHIRIGQHLFRLKVDAA